MRGALFDPSPMAGADLLGIHPPSWQRRQFRRTADCSKVEDLTSAVFLPAWRRRSEVVL
ncbi:hypothetical protein [Streptomyces griseofuscus]|uniref:hypothetical protein n=1 Tax=Streptomyces griseofuscus TaxID=146922 RepID=UPI003F4D40F9